MSLPSWAVNASEKSYNTHRAMLRLVSILLALSSALVARGSGGDDAEDAREEAAQSAAPDVRRRLLQERNREALVRLRSLLSDHLSQTPATLAPYPPRTAGRRRQLISAARRAYATQCLYEPLSSPQSSDEASQRRRHLTQESASAAPPPPPDSSAGAAELLAAAAADSGGRCYLNPSVLAHPDFPDPENPIEVMLMKSAWTAYQCSFERRPQRCGTYRHPPYDCRWQDDSGRCAVGSDYLLPRLLAYLHCRDDATLTPFWDRCYTVGVLTNDPDWCGQSDGNWARCWWYPARNDSEVDLCAPSRQGGVDSRHAYDELVAQMRSGIWQQDWFGSCPTSELVYTIKAACNWTQPADCAADPSCQLRPDLPIEYGMCRLRDELIWEALFGSGSALFNATAAAMAECAAASAAGPEACAAAGSLAPEPGGEVPVQSDKWSDLIDLVFIEEVTPGGAAAPPRPCAALLLLAGVLMVVVRSAMVG
ncbi:hypothetical protein PLESTB_000195600 [Pleodorina starrii]|uniref:Uncharacterized protein n=1 Tax=Pleodorina starrii TaxID=330485 RepID=A0A9W6BBY3_9CHLO|nr:hypothetical protein PLESTM_000335700 [Pleodorina starrii]GLC49218.1 hypothetical protein PLESTB_000195600 [Pleodorina starrii]GLC73525.1 hypothetical protein PLESTF_001387000 [Pleodorina starrii]